MFSKIRRVFDRIEFEAIFRAFMTNVVHFYENMQPPRRIVNRPAYTMCPVHKPIEKLYFSRTERSY